ncbi:MAG: hypothetical protein U0599_08615 [Vicinamibacteria bacterium]
MIDRLPLGRACRLGLGPALGVLLSVGLAGSAAAQAPEPAPTPTPAPTPAPTPDLPASDTVTPPPADQPIAGGRPVPGPIVLPGLTSAPQRPRRSPWNLTLRAGEGWVRNPGAVPGGTASSPATRGSVAVGYQRTGGRSTVGLSADAAGARYHDYGTLNNVGGGGSIRLARTLSPRASVTVGDSLETRYAYENSLLMNSGVVLGPVRTLTNVATAGFGYRFGSVTSFTVDARHERVDFDSPTLVDGSQLALGATINHRRSVLGGLGASYLFVASTTAAQRSESHTAYGSWRRLLGPRWTTGLSLGITHSSRAQGNYPYAVGELGATYGRAFFSARFSTNLSQAYGAGYEQEVRTAGLTVRRAVGRRVTASLSGVFADAEAILSPAAAAASGSPPGYRTLNATGAIRVRISRAWGLDMDAFTMRLRPRPGAALVTVADTVTGGAGLAFVYETPNR